MTMHNFYGTLIRLDKIVAIGPVKSIRTGTAICDWAYGFEIFLDGNTVPFVPPCPNGYGYAHGPTSEQYKQSIENLRAELLRLAELS